MFFLAGLLGMMVLGSVAVVTTGLVLAGRRVPVVRRVL